MGGRKIKLWSVLACFLALAYTLWPVARWLRAERENGALVDTLEARMAAMGEGEREVQRNLAKWYNYNLEQGTPGLSWTYGGILNFGNGMMALLEVPELDLRLPIFHGPEGAVGHDPESSLPIGGRGNHTVLTLSERYRWAEGQLLYIDCLETRLAYRVESVQVMPGGWSTARPTEAGQDLLTLVYDRGSTRTLIRCLRCSELNVRETERAMPLRSAALAWLAPFLLIFPALWRERRYAAGVQNTRICGFNRKKCGKVRLS